MYDRQTDGVNLQINLQDHPAEPRYKKVQYLLTYIYLPPLSSKAIKWRNVRPALNYLKTDFFHTKLMQQMQPQEIKYNMHYAKHYEMMKNINDAVSTAKFCSYSCHQQTYSISLQHLKLANSFQQKSIIDQFIIDSFHKLTKNFNILPTEIINIKSYKNMSF